MDNYLKQAKEFLNKTGTTLTIVFDGQRDRFNSGTSTDVYRCELINNKGSYSFEFSNSIVNSKLYRFKNPKAIGTAPVDYTIVTDLLKECINPIRAKRTPTGNLKQYFSQEEYKEVERQCETFVKRRTTKKNAVKNIMKFLFEEQERKEPNEYDVLACLNIYHVEDFADFATEFGYDLSTAEDIRKAQKTFQAVKSEERALKDLFNEDEIEQLMEIQ